MIPIGGRRGCRAHRAALLEFAAQRTGGPDVRRALDHVERCRSCEEDLAATTLVLHALRGLHEDARRAEPAPDGWSRLRARLAATRREPSRLLSGMPGIVAAAALCAALAGPGAVTPGGPPRIYNEAPRDLAPGYVAFEESRERARSEGLLPVPARVLSVQGVPRATLPPLATGLPSWERRQRFVVEELTPASQVASAAAADDSTARRQVGRR
ncbi:MAG: hypothetical protein M0T75_12355 [Chloroflexi bacterium]|nr:hypothetical protein [Chloroflexota bacterium]